MLTKWFQPNNSPDAKLALMGWLERFVANPQSWNIGVALLNGTTEHPQYYGATILVDKISKEWPALATEAKSDLLRYLLEQIRRFAQGPPLVRSQVCVAIATVVIHCGPEQWPNFFEEMGLLATNYFQMETRFAYLLLMQVVAEEVHNDKRKLMSEQRKKDVGFFVKTHSVGTLQVMLQLLQIAEMEKNELMKESAIKSLNAWLLLEPSVEMPHMIDLLLNICDMMVKLLQDPSLDKPLDIVEVLGTIIAGKIVEHHDALRRILRSILNLHDTFEIVVEEDEDDFASALCYLFALVGENTLSRIYADQELGPAFIRVVTDCTSHSNQDVVETILPCWSELAYAFEEADENVAAELRPLYEELVVEAVGSLLSQLQLPVDYKDFKKDDFVELENYRAMLSDAILSCAQIIGFHPVFEAVYGKMVEAIKTTRATPPPAQPVFEDACLCLEAVFNSLRKLTELVPDEDTTCVGKILQAYPFLPTFPRLQRIALTLLGELRYWIALHQDSIGVILPQFIMPALSVPELALNAARAVKDIAIECHERILPNLHAILAPAVKVLPSLSPHQRSMVVESVTLVLTLLQVGVAEQNILEMLRPSIELVSSLTNGPKTKEAAKAINEELKVIALGCYVHIDSKIQLHSKPNNGRTENRLESIMYDHNGRRRLDDAHPFTLTLKTIWPIVGLLVKDWSQSSDVVHGVCLLYTRAMSGMQRVQFMPFLSDVLMSLSSFYQANAMVSLLKTLRAVVLIYRTTLPTIHGSVVHTKVDPANPPTPPNIPQEVRTAISQTFALFVEKSVNTLPTAALPELTKEFFEFCCAVFECIPEAMGTPEVPILQPIIKCAMDMMCGVTEKSACQAIFAFLMALLAQRVTGVTPVVGHMLNACFGPLLVKCLLAIAGEMQRSYLDNVANLLTYFVAFYPNETRQTLEKVFAEQPTFPSPKLTSDHKRHFVTQLFVKKGSVQLLAVVNDFALACKGLMYAVPTQPLL